MLKPELLAPAGNEKCAYAAVQSGADSIYLGLKNFGARSFAENFDEESLEQVVDYCHLRGVKVYVTLNTLTADIEILQVTESARFCANAGVDGVIVQDMGLITLIKKLFPELPVHISTQAAVMNNKGVELAEELGAERTVVARELSFAEIKSITEKCSSEIEIFVHGAQCYSYSGQCLMSSIYGGRSGNRGKCAGPCRLPYVLEKNGKPLEKGYLLSPVDMCLGLNIDKVLNTGAACLKIEGRMKGPEYVAASCEIYKEALAGGKNISPSGLEILENTFSRGGFTAGLFEGGDNRIKKQGSNDDAYAKQQEKLLEPFRNAGNANRRKIPVEMCFTAKKGEKAKLTLKVLGRVYVVLSEREVQAAASAPLEKERIARQLEKLGDYPFEPQKTLVDCEEDIFMPIGEINAMRRKAAEEAAADIKAMYKRNYPQIKPTKPAYCKAKKRFFTASAENENQARALLEIDAVREVYLPAEAYISGGFADDPRVIPSFPAIVREKRLDKYLSLLESIERLGVKKLQVKDWGMLKAASHKRFNICVGSDMNVFNSYTAQTLSGMGATRIALSPEMLLKQVGSICSTDELEITLYGRLPLMKTANCPLKGMKKCGENSLEYSIRDRKGEKIPLMCQCGDCTAYLLNSKPVYMADKLKDIPENITALCLQFTVETPAECRNIAKACISGREPEGNFTRGHFYRGVL